jgi:hypothetical protein
MGRFNAAYWNLILGAIGVIGLLIPAIILKLVGNNNNVHQHDQVHDDPQMLKQFESIEFKLSGLALLISSCPVILDVFIDIITGNNNLSENERTCWITRLLISVVSALAGLQFTFQNNYFNVYGSYALNYLFIVWCIRFVWLSSILSCLCILRPYLFQSHVTLLATGCLSFLGILKFNIAVFNSTNTTLINITEIIVKCWLFIFLIVFCFWGYKLLRPRKSYSVDDYTCLLYWSTLFCTHMGPFGFIVCFNFDFSNFPFNQTFHNYIYVAATVVISVITGQIARYNATVSKDHIISTKEAYVRYISHELR